MSVNVPNAKYKKPKKTSKPITKIIECDKTLMATILTDLRERHSQCLATLDKAQEIQRLVQNSPTMSLLSFSPPDEPELGELSSEWEKSFRRDTKLHMSWTARSPATSRIDIAEVDRKNIEEALQSRRAKEQAERYSYRKLRRVRRGF
jgi:hypothetical protein